MDFKSLETFLWINRLGSFRAASQRLNAAQPSISARVAGLERELGVTLFERGSRGATPTSAGRDLLDYAERLISLQAEMLERVGHAGQQSGIVRLGVVETIVYIWLPELIRAINQRFPAVHIELDVDTSINLADKLARNDLDIAFLMGPIQQPDVIESSLCEYSLQWVASPDLPLPPEPVSLDALGEWPLITYPRLSRPNVELQHMLARAPNRTRIHANSSIATIIRMTMDGIGVSALPVEIIERELARGLLRPFEAEAVPSNLRFKVAYKDIPGFSLGANIAAMAKHIAAAASQARAERSE